MEQKPLTTVGVIMMSIAVLQLSACNDSSSKATHRPLAVKILHINDHHSHLEADTSAALQFDGQSTRVEMGGFPKVVAKINERAAAATGAVLKIHAGDAITGDLYYTLFKGEADAKLMNQVCFDVFEFGNHEFDDGDAALKQFLDYLDNGCNTPVIAANVVPEVGVSPLTPNSATDFFKPYFIKEFNGEKVGLIGIDIAGKTSNSSNPLPTTQFLDETETAQRYIDELQGKGLNKIILVTHYGYENDLTLAKNLSGVDVIVGGDSHTLLGETLSDFGLNPSGPYPTQVTDKDGNPVCIVQAWQYSLAVGELDVQFDADGKVTECSGTPNLLLGDTFKRQNAEGSWIELEGEDRDKVLKTIANTPALSIVTPDAATDTLLQDYAAQVEELKQSVIGKATENLCFERIPGLGYSTICDVSATSAHGSDISTIVALAFKEQSLRADMAILNAGGVRSDVPAGDITIGDAYVLLPFSNTLINLELTGAEVVQTLEEAFSYALDPNGSSGSYPYASGLRWEVDRSKPQGQRFSNVEVKSKDETKWHPIDLERTYVVVTISYLASGKDGYLTFGKIFQDETKVEDTFLEYAQAFVDYVEKEGEVSKLPVAEYSTQKYYDENGQLQN